MLTTAAKDGTMSSRPMAIQNEPFDGTLWFPKGEGDPDIAVLRVDVTEADYWEASSSKLIMGLKYIAAATTGGTLPVGEAGHVTV